MSQPQDEQKIDLSRVGCDFCTLQWPVNTEDEPSLRAAAPEIFGHIYTAHPQEWIDHPEYAEFAAQFGVVF